MTARTFPAQFSTVGDLLWSVERGGLRPESALIACDDGRLGPLVELALARARDPEKLGAVSIDGYVGRIVSDAFEFGRISGDRPGELVGIFPLTNPSGMRVYEDRYTQWRLRFQTAAMDGGCPRAFALALSGALGELVDNVHEHAEEPRSAVAGFRVQRGRVEIVVADAGVGALSSLRQNPKHAGLPDAAAALRAIVHEGATRHPDETHHGQGVRQLFRTLAGHYGHLRFRTGDHALALRGEGSLDRGMLESRTEAPLPGFMVNVLCVLPAPSAAT